jgi:hypothetical protein
VFIGFEFIEHERISSGYKLVFFLINVSVMFHSDDLVEINELIDLMNQDHQKAMADHDHASGKNSF